jgi:hypothetical protein
MTDEYTPTVEEVRRQWNNAVRSDLVPTRSAEFDSMIAEVEARGLEKAAEEWQTKGWAGTPRSADRVADRMGASQYALNWMRARAQQVREGN